MEGWWCGRSGSSLNASAPHAMPHAMRRRQHHVDNDWHHIIVAFTLTWPGRSHRVAPHTGEAGGTLRKHSSLHAGSPPHGPLHLHLPLASCSDLRLIVQDTASLCLFAQNKITGVVLAIGYTQTYAAPVINGKVVRSALQPVRIGGSTLTQYFMRLMQALMYDDAHTTHAGTHV